MPALLRLPARYGLQRVGLSVDDEPAVDGRARAQDRFKGKVLRIRVALKRFGVNSQQVQGRRASSPILRPAGLAVNVAVFDTADESELSLNVNDSIAATAQFEGS